MREKFEQSEQGERGETRELAANEVFELEGREPYMNREEAMEAYGYNAAIVAKIGVGDGTELLLLDTANVPEDEAGIKRLVEGGEEEYVAPWLLVQPKVFEESGGRNGYKGVQNDGESVRLGRSFLKDRFEYDPTVSRDQLAVVADKDGRLRIENHNPSNMTVLEIGRRKEENVETGWEKLAKWGRRNEAARRNLETNKLEGMGRRERREYLKRAEIDGDEWTQEQDGGIWRGKLTVDMLEKVDLVPEYKVELSGARVGLSRPYKIGGRLAVMGYVKTDEGIKVRSYYQSKSQGMWRYMPDYMKGHPNADLASWYGKGYGEESLTLPAELQEALAKMSEEAEIVEMKVNPDFLLCGTAKFAGMGEGDYYREVSGAPEYEFGGEDLTSPERIEVPVGAEPEFSKKVGEYNFRSDTAGEAKAEVYESRDGGTKWTFCRDKDGRTWVGNIETSGKVGSTGLHETWVKGGGVTVPLYEYPGQAGMYGDAEDWSGRYIGMYKNYISKIPVFGFD